ncbi:MAG TPA: glycosyltransferase 87 family protein [Ktedonobacterales bacterium]|nr:glycosyltransferase 87 family protein [Ktedonobacterales bacterium]
MEWRGALRRWWQTREARLFGALLLLALLARIPLTPWFSFYGDQNAYIYWGSALHTHFFDLYSALARTPNPRLAPQYPPPAMYLFGACTTFYQALASIFALPALSYTHPSHVLIAVMKLPSIACDLGTISVIYALARRAAPTRWALIAAASYAFAPAVLLDGAIWGQTDAIMLLPLLLALVCTLRRKGIAAGALLALAMLIKPQPVIFAPLLLLHLWRWAGWRQAAKAVAAMAATALLLCSPYLLPPHPEMAIFVQHMLASTDFSLAASPTAFNLWVALLIPNRYYLAPYLGPLSVNTLGDALFICCMLLALAAVWRDGSPARLYRCAGFVALAFFGVMTLQLERYLFPAPALFLLAAVYQRQAIGAYIVCSVTLALNILARIIGGVDSAHWATSLHSGYSALSFTVSLVNIGLLAWLAGETLRAQVADRRKIRALALSGSG